KVFGTEKLSEPLARYSDVYGDVLLGLHDDVASLQEQHDVLATDVGRVLTHAERVESACRESTDAMYRSREAGWSAVRHAYAAREAAVEAAAAIEACSRVEVTMRALWRQVYLLWFVVVLLGGLLAAVALRQ